jgi:hypothetical protein
MQRSLTGRHYETFRGWPACSAGCTIPAGYEAPGIYDFLSYGRPHGNPPFRARLKSAHVPLYLEMPDANILFVGRARLSGNTSLEQKIPLKGLKAKPRRAIINYYDDVLASPG